MNRKEIKKLFIEFFEKKNHKLYACSSVINKEDPTLIFTNSGMNQFKQIFLNPDLSKDKRIITIQPCIRISGKHNDLEDVGIDLYHHTLFEMMGNWSFDDFFKKEAISWAFELLTHIYKIDKNRIYVTTFGGDINENLEKDVESFEIWKTIIDENRIINNESKKNNFWEMGANGPCGPCTEIHIDIRDEKERKKIKGIDLVNKDHPEVIEIWNIVFIEYERLICGKLKKLEKKSVDTGMGFERLSMVLQNKKSTYQTDSFSQIIKFIEEKTNFKYGFSEKTDIAIRVISDHIRTIAFCLFEKCVPSNKGDGYVIKRVIRRAIRYGYSFLNQKEPFLYKILEKFCEILKEENLEIFDQRVYICNILEKEEINFFKTLSIGISMLQNIIKNSFEKKIDGKQAFTMFDTYGFPIDLTNLIAKENGFEVDMEDFEKEMQIQKDRSKNESFLQLGDWIIVQKSEIESLFLGYDNFSCKSKILRFRKVKDSKEEFYQIVLNQTVIYPEGGGQVSDDGILENYFESIQIKDAKKENGIIFHRIDSLPKNLKEEFVCSINIEKRKNISKNHSAIHLLNFILRENFGSQIEQRGSFVCDKYFRFDFSCLETIDSLKFKKIEKDLNTLLKKNLKMIEKRDINILDAKKNGAIGIFEDKYGEKVRVISFSDKSIELCGGTHVQNSSEISIVKLKSCVSISSGIKRIEGISGDEAEKYLFEKFETLQKVEILMKNPKDLEKFLESKLDLEKKNQKILEKYQENFLEIFSERLISEVQTKKYFNFLFYKTDFELTSQMAKNLSNKILSHIKNLIIVLIFKNEEKNSFIFSNSKDLTFKVNAKFIFESFKEKKKIVGGGTDNCFIGNCLVDLEKIDFENIFL